MKMVCYMLTKNRNRVLLLGSPRSGSSYVFELFKEASDLLAINEPFNPASKFWKQNNIDRDDFMYNFYNHSNIVVKTHIHQTKKKDINTFDKLYKICRRSRFEQTVSLARSKTNGIWNLNKIENIEPVEIHRHVMFESMIKILRSREMLKDEDITGTTIYYEDLSFNKDDCCKFDLNPEKYKRTDAPLVKLPAYADTIRNFDQVKSWYDEWNVK